MPQIESIISWLIEKTYHIENCQDSDIDIGTLNNFIHLAQKKGKSDPLTIRLNYPQAHRKKEQPDLKFLINDDEQYTTQFIKRIEYTPFYYSYVTGKNFSLDLIDFYHWEAPITHYRIFIIQHHETYPEITLHYSFNDTFRKKNRQILNKDWTLHSSSDLSWNEGKGCYILTQSFKKTYQNIVLFALQWDKYNHIDLSLNNVFAQLQLLEAKSRESHIMNFFVIKNSAANRDLDNLWMKQKLFTPDRDLDYVLRNYPGDYDIALTWVIELSLSMGWHDILIKLLKMLKIEKKKGINSPRLIYWEYFLDSFFNPHSDHQIGKIGDLKPNQIRDSENAIDPFVNLLDLREHNLIWGNIVSEECFIYQAYFSNTISEDRIATFLQIWWNIYSQPLFSRRFEEDLRKKPEKIFIIYLLTLKLNLPWAEYLYNYSCQFCDNEIFQVIAFLKQRLCAWYETREQMWILSGPQWDNNIKSIEVGQDKLGFAFTKYGKKKYITLRERKQTIFRIDHEVKLSYDKRHQNITIIPNVVGISKKLSTIMIILIEVANYRLSLPLSWRQGEVVLAGLRFRWILKKRRFQFTVIKKNKIDTFLINGQQFALDGRFKMKFYLNAKQEHAQIHLQLLDHYGRNFHQRILPYRREVLISGFCMDSYGLFMEHFNYNYDSRNRLAKIDPSGNIWQKTELPVDKERLTIQIKDYKKQLDLMIIKNAVFENILRFSPQEWFTDFSVMIDHVLIPKFTEINLFFEKYFAFRPHYRINTDDRFYPSGRVFIYICSHHSVIKIKNDRRMAPYPIIEVGIKGGLDNIENLYGYLIEPFKKMELEADSA